MQHVRLAAEDRADPRLVQQADLRIDRVQPFDQRLVPAVDRAVVVEGAAALILPGAGHRSDAGGGVHVVRAVAFEAEAVPGAEERSKGSRVGKEGGSKGST